MMEINGYEVYELQSTPIRTVYRGHHKKVQPHRSCTIEAIFEEDVPQCYKQLLKHSNADDTKPSNYYIPKSEILLRHIFTSPQHPHLIFFVQYEPASFRNHLQLSLQKRFNFIFQLVTTISWILRQGLIHDFSLDNVAFGKQAIYFYDFIINGQERTEAGQLSRRVELLIAQLLQNEEESLGNFSVDISDKLDSVCVKWRKKIGKGHVQMSYRFDCVKEVVNITSRQHLDDQPANTWQKQVPLSKLKEFIPSYDLHSTKWHIPLIGKKNLVECALYVDEVGGCSGGQIKVKDNVDGEYPYNTVGALIGKMICKTTGATIKIFGSAVLVGENLLMTCAHNFYSLKVVQVDGKKYQYIYEAILEDMKFVHNNISYQIQAVRFPQQYRKLILSPYRKKDDYALVKLKLEEGQKVDIKLFPEIVNNYKETELGLKIKGFYQRHEQQNINSRLAQGNDLKFKEKQKLLIYEYDSKDKGTEGGFSGGPIFIILAELAYGFKYHLIIGIHIAGQNGQKGQAVFFTQQIISNFVQWQQQLTLGKGKRFNNILNFSRITNLDQVCKTMSGLLDDIVFSPVQKEYLPKLFAQIKYQKLAHHNVIEDMYKQAVPEIREKKNEILLAIESSKYQQRHNNIIYMYHLRDYQNWFAPWQSFGESQGFFVFYIYIVLKLEYFFARAKVSRQRGDKFKDFQDFLAKQVDQSYQTRKYCIVAAFNIQLRIKQMQDWLKEIKMNGNLRKLLLFEVQFLKCLFPFLFFMPFCKPDAKLFEVSKVCILGFLAKEYFRKVVEADSQMRHYLFVFNEIILVSIKCLLEEDKLLEAKEAKISFAWSVRKLIKDHPSLLEDYLRFDPNHIVFMSQEKRKQQEEAERMIKQHVFGEQVRQYLKKCMQMLMK